MSLDSSSSALRFSALSGAPFPRSSDAFLACCCGRLWVPSGCHHRGCCSLLVQLRRPQPERAHVSGLWPGAPPPCPLCECCLRRAAPGEAAVGGSAFRAAVPGHRVPSCPLCAPPPQVWPPGQRRGECGAPTEPADRGGVASGAGGEQTG